jgi:predicted TIM-barrel fold metal-dependent hydrolase
MDVFGIDRAVIVQPSVYGFDNRLLVEVVKSDSARFRGIAVIDPDSSDDEQLYTLHAAGIRGVRFNLLHPAGLPLAALMPLADRIRRYGWHTQILGRVAELPELEEIATESGVPMVIDHLGLVDPGKGSTDIGVQRLLRLTETGRCFIKLSAPYRLAGDVQQVQALVTTLVDAVPHTLLWGTDWPHPEFYDVIPDDVALVDLVGTWLPTPTLRQQVLIDNPLRLYWS